MSWEFRLKAKHNLRMDLNLSNKTAVVCGSTQGIGWAAAQQLAQQGAKVILMARNEEMLEKRSAALPSPNGVEHAYQVADFSSNEQVRTAISRLTEKESVHILINNTGGPPPGPAHRAEADAFLTAFRNHLINNQILAQHCLSGMKDAGFGRIVNVISTSVKIPLKGLGVSNTVRGAVASWSKTLANELGSFGITVNNVLPGATETERLSQIIQNKAAKTGKSEEEVTQSMLADIPAGRFGKPEELGATIGFLCSPAAAYINGVSIPVDGGRTGSL